MGFSISDECLSDDALSSVSAFSLCHSKTHRGPIFYWILSSKYSDGETGLIYYGHRFYMPETGRWASRDPMNEDVQLHLYQFVRNDSIDHGDYLGYWSWNTLDIPASPSKCRWVNRLLNAWAVGLSQTLLDHWRTAGGAPMTVNFSAFDFGGTERADVKTEALRRAAALGPSAACGATVQGNYNETQPQFSNRHTYIVTPMIYGYKFWWECSLSATKNCDSSQCCKDVSLKADCRFHAKDTVDFWDNDWSAAWVPPVFIKDRLVRACNPKGQGFDVTAEATGCESGKGTCGGQYTPSVPPYFPPVP